MIAAQSLAPGASPTDVARLVSVDVDITVIRSWLGHVSLDPTNHYAQANLETKHKALERVGAPTPSDKQPPWKRDASVLAWLDALWDNVQDETGKSKV